MSGMAWSIIATITSQRLFKTRRFRPGWMLAILLTARVVVGAPDYHVRNWQVENGLPDNTVTALAQTPDGYLWVGTRKGLVRFDGASFKPAEAAGNSSLNESGIIGLLTDNRGGLWIASWTGLIARLAEGEFPVQYVPDEINPGHLDAQSWRNLKSVLARDSAGNIWVLLINGEIRLFDRGGGVSLVTTNGLPGGTVHGLANDIRGRIWLLKGTNVCVFSGEQWQVSEKCAVRPLSQILGPAGKTGLYISMPNSSGSDAFVTVIQDEPGQGWQTTTEPIPTTPAHPLVMAMLEKSDGQLWLAQRWGGIYLRVPDGWWAHLQSGSLATLRTANCFLTDDRNNLWIGTDEQGLLRASEPPVKVSLLPQQAIDANLHVTTVAAARDGGFWAGTDAALYHGAPEQSRLENPVKGLSGESIYSVLEDTRTNLWVGTQNGLFHGTGDGVHRVLSLPEDSGGILVLYEARNGCIWAGGPHDNLFFWLAGERPAHFEAVAAVKHAAAICCMTEDAIGRIWIGTRNAGIFRVENNRLVADGPMDVLTSSIRAVLFDPEGALWIGTDRDGLFRWSCGITQHYIKENGLPDDVILGLATDDLGNIWMTSHNGIMGAARRQLASYEPGKSPPLLCWHLRLDEEFRICSGAGQPVLSPSGAGGFWAATMSGVTQFNPKVLVSAKSSMREAHLETLTADGSVIPASARGFRVSSGTRRLEFQYSMPELGTPEDLRFRYRLDGLDLNWLEAGSMRSATYSRLPPGDYRFRVMVGGEDRIWRETAATMDLQVVPPFWQTGWFQALGLGFMILTAAGISIWNERRKVRRRLERLEARQAIERMRQRIARDLHDELGSAITAITQRSDMTLQSEAPPETLRASVRGISGRLRQLSVTLDEIVWTMNSRNDTLTNLVGYISNHAQEFMLHSRIRCRLDVARNLPDVAVDSETRHNLFLAVKEALHNAAKHSGATEVIVRVHYDQDWLRVSIEDNGQGFDTATVNNGEGLKNMTERLETVRGQTEIVSKPAGGTRVSFLLNLFQSPVVQTQYPQS